MDLIDIIEATVVLTSFIAITVTSVVKIKYKIQIWQFQTNVRILNKIKLRFIHSSIYLHLSTTKQSFWHLSFPLQLLLHLNWINIFRNSDANVWEFFFLSWGSVYLHFSTPMQSLWHLSLPLHWFLHVLHLSDVHDRSSIMTIFSTTSGCCAIMIGCCWFFFNFRSKPA